MQKDMPILQLRFRHTGAAQLGVIFIIKIADNDVKDIYM